MLYTGRAGGLIATKSNEFVKARLGTLYKHGNMAELQIPKTFSFAALAYR